MELAGGGLREVADYAVGVGLRVLEELLLEGVGIEAPLYLGG